METTTAPKAKDPRKQWQGAVNRAQGQLFEEDIAAALRYYAASADIEKTPEPMKVLKPLEGGRFVACFTRAAQPDFNGVIKGGQAVSFEAKHTSTGKLTQDCVNEEQTRRLNNRAALGAMCFVIAGFGRDAYRVPWSVWCNMKLNFGRKYVTPADLDIWKLPRSDKGILLIFSKTKGATNNE